MYTPDTAKLLTPSDLSRAFLKLEECLTLSTETIGGEVGNSSSLKTPIDICDMSFNSLLPAPLKDPNRDGFNDAADSVASD